MGLPALHPRRQDPPPGVPDLSKPSAGSGGSGGGGSNECSVSEAARMYRASVCGESDLYQWGALAFYALTKKEWRAAQVQSRPFHVLPTARVVVVCVCARARVLSAS